MKKVIFIVLISSIAVFTAYSQSGKIRELSGEVEIKLVGAAAFVPAQVGNTVAQDTIVSTGFKSTAIIEVGSNVITVRPLTRLSLSEIQSSANAETLNINLQAGRIRVDVKPPAGTKANTSVQSPSATASVRGTSFDMDIKNLAVNEGRVAWGGADGITVSVSPGRVNTINTEGNVESPVAVTTASVLPPSPVGTTSTGKNSGEKNKPGNSSNADGDVGVDIIY